MMVASIGWFVVHALWMGALLGGLAALCFGVLPDRRAPLRYRIGYGALLLMALCPLAAVLVTLDVFTQALRLELTQVAEQTVGLASIVEWRARVVRGAAIVWMVGVAMLALRIGGEWRRVRALRRSASGDPGAVVRSIVDSLAADLGVRTPVTVRTSARAEVPMMFGWRRTLILLPRASVAEVPPDQLRAVLAHELAHVRRGDYAANVIQLIADTALWFHPAARWLSRRIRAEREYCCDDVAVRMAASASSYARALAALEEARGHGRLAVAAASGTLLDRIQRVAGVPRPAPTLARGVAALALAMLVAWPIVTLAMIVPPAIPLDARLRARSPMPAPPPNAPALPQLPRPAQR